MDVDINIWIFDLLWFWLNRRAVLWVESVPTPAKSKMLSEIKVRMGHFFSFRYQLLHIWVVVIWLNHELMFSSLHTLGRWCRVRPCLCAKCTSWTVYQHGTSLLPLTPPHLPVSRQITTKTNSFEARVNELWTISSYLEKATLCSVSPLQLFRHLVVAK